MFMTSGPSEGISMIKFLARVQSIVASTPSTSSILLLTIPSPTVKRTDGSL